MSAGTVEHRRDRTAVHQPVLLREALVEGEREIDLSGAT
jgi:hypothetical protein